jgi:hypothetical protein
VRGLGKRIATAGALALLAGGCGMVPRTAAPPEPVRAERAAREVQMNREWQNQTLADLLRDMGRPRLLLDIPGGGNPPGFVLVYARDAGTGCLDTFAVMYGVETRVRLYQCR